MSGPFPRVALKRVAKLGTGHTPSRSHPEYWVDRTIPWLTLADVGPLRDGTLTVVTKTKEMISELGVANSAAVVHPAGTVAMSRTASVGFSAILGRDMATSQDYVTWTCGEDAHPRFILHCLRGLRSEILASRMGSTHQTIYMPDVERIRVPLPPLEQQHRIATFLTSETARIDALVAAKQHQLRAAQLRFSVVSRIKTSSGVQVPLRRLVRTVKTGTTPPDVVLAPLGEGVPWHSPSDFASLLRLRPAARHLPVEVVQSGRAPRFPKGAVLVIGVGATAGGIAHLQEEATGNQQVTALVPNERVQNRYLAWWLNARSVELKALAPYTTLPILGNDYLRSLQVDLPPMEDQIEAAAALDRLASATTRLTNTLTRQIGLLKERRQALITAAVTGEIEV